MMRSGRTPQPSSLANAHDKQHSQGSATGAPRSSLSAPNRNRSITIDDYKEDTTAPPSAVWEIPPADRMQGTCSSSDSDDDENDNESRRCALGKRKRIESTSLRHKKSASALSLESLPNESEGSGSSTPTAHPVASRRSNSAVLGITKASYNEGELPAKRQDLETNSAHVQASHSTVEIPTSKPQGEGGREEQVQHKEQQAGNGNPGLSAHELETDAAMERNVGPKFAVQVAASNASTCAKCATVLRGGSERSASCRCDETRRSSGSSPSGLQPTSRDSGRHVTNGDEAEAGIARRGRAKDRSLVNIAAVPESDGPGWDRYIFFSFRAQRFHFPTNMFLSAFSPFAAVASAMDGVTAAGVCAVCGAGGLLKACSRCPLAFHSACIDPLGGSTKHLPWFCNACQAVKRGDNTVAWHPARLPPPLPSPSSGFARLTADAKDGNPIDFVFNPTLFNYYKSQCGVDWLRCWKCKEIKVADDGVLAESVHIPFECEFAFWRSDGEKHCCRVPYSNRMKSKAVETVEAYIRQRSRRRNALFYHGFGEEDRTAYGYPPSDAVEDVIVIEEDEPSTVREVSSPDLEFLQTRDSAINDRNVRRKNDLACSRKGKRRREASAGVQGADKRFSDPAHVQQDTDFVFTFGKPDTRANEGLLDAVEIAGTLKSCGENVTSATRTRRAEGGASLAPGTSNLISSEHHMSSGAVKSSTINKTAPVRLAEATVELHQEGLETRSAHNHNGSERSGPQVHGKITAPDGWNAAGRVVEGRPIASYSLPPTQLISDVKHEDEADENANKHTVREGPSGEEPHPVLQYIASLDLDGDVEDCLTDLALANDKSLNQLYLVYHGAEVKFKRHATRLANRLMRKKAQKDSLLRGAGNTQTVADTAVTATEGQPCAVDNMSKAVEGKGVVADTARFGARTLSAEGTVKPAGESDWDPRYKELLVRQVQEMNEMRQQMRLQMVGASGEAFFEVCGRHAVMLKELEMKHEAQKREMMSLLEVEFRRTAVGQHSRF